MDAFLGLFNNPLVLNLLGLIVKFAPGIRTFVPNRLIPVLLAVTAWLTSLVGPAEAHAAGFAFGLGGILGGLAPAVWQAAQAWVVNEMFLRPFSPKKPLDSR